MNRRSALRVTAAVAVVAVAYAAGLATDQYTGLHHTAKPPAADAVINQALSSIESKAAHPVPKGALEQAAIQGMLSALRDKWATFYDADDFKHFQQVLDGGYTGLGIWLHRQADGALQVMSVQPHSPAASVGVKVGDRIVAIDGHAIASTSVSTATSDLRGAAGTSVAITMSTPTGIVRTVSMRRSKLADDDVAVSMLTPTIETIKIHAFTSGVGAEVKSAVAAAKRQHLVGIVLDLRDDPGGLLDEAVETASVFIAHGPVVTYVQRGHSPVTLDALGGANTTIPLVVLVDGGTASAAEIVASCLQDHGRAVLLGSQTFGKGTVQASQRLSNGSAIDLTIGHYLTPDDKSLQGVGITPDVYIPSGTAESVVRARALEVLSGLTADAGSAGRG